MAKTDAGVYLHIDGFEGFDRSIDFNRRAVRRAMQRSGAVVTQAARRLVSSKAGPSRAGHYPARRTGRLARSIRAKVSRSGFMVRIEPKTGQAVPPSDPYFVYLHYGVRRGAKRRTDHRAQAVGPYRIAPRAMARICLRKAVMYHVRRIGYGRLARAMCGKLSLKWLRFNPLKKSRENKA